MIERKCVQCGTWNNEEDYCKNCGAPLSPKAIQLQKDEIAKKKEAEREPDKLEILMEKAKNHKIFIVRWFYWVAYSVGILVSVLGALVAWFVAMVNA